MRYINLILVLFLLNSAIYSQVSENNWAVFRGKSDLSGNTEHDLTNNPSYLWSLPTDVMTKSSPVVSDGVIYFGNDKGTLYAISEKGSIL